MATFFKITLENYHTRLKQNVCKNCRNGFLMPKDQHKLGKSNAYPKARTYKIVGIETKAVFNQDLLWWTKT